MMPAFSSAIFSRVSPRISVWSRSMWHRTLQAGSSTTFVASSLPPMPTSSTTTSQPARSKQTMASAVMRSKTVGLSSICSTHCSRISAARHISSSETSSPSMRMRSLYFRRWGDVYSPVLYPASCSTDASMAAVDPLPLVPAIWTNCILFWGSPARCSSCFTRDSPRRLPIQLDISKNSIAC